MAVEKNLEALLSLELPGSVALIGEGPARERLARRYPHAHFLGARFGEALAEAYASADVFVFPSRTDTFGVVLLEAMASGLPVAAFPAPGPLDVVSDSGAGVLDEDLRAACLQALDIPREAARARAQQFTWAESARQFLGHIDEAREARFSRTA
jgi:glycosyltransferase involved in cell wall biosynthesis